MTATASTGVTEDIRDIRGPKTDLNSPSVIVPALIGAAILIALCVYIFRRRRGGGTPARQLSLLEQTLQSLDQTRPLMNPATAREFGNVTSEVVRNYIEKRFNVVATQRTTEEFLASLLQGSNDTLARHRPLLAEFLQQSDYLKFAGTSLAAADLEALFNSARGFVVETSAQ
jgi:Domain of unknown function (DUF4381)